MPIRNQGEYIAPNALNEHLPQSGLPGVRPLNPVATPGSRKMYLFVISGFEFKCFYSM